MAKLIIIIIVTLGLFGGLILLTRGGGDTTETTPANNVVVENGKQYIDINVKGGYFPSKSVAKAGMPTVLRFKTEGTFDCSIALRIPKLNVSKNLPQTGTTEIDIGNQAAGKLTGMCAMGMYNFEVQFQS